MNFKYYAVVLGSALALSIMFSACHSDKKDLCSINVTNISGTYKLQSLTYKSSASATEQDYMSMLDDCEKDDQVILHANGTYEEKDMGTSCDPSSDDAGTWSLQGNIIISDGVVNGAITQFDCSIMVCKAQGIFTPGDQLIFTFKKQ